MRNLIDLFEQDVDPVLALIDRADFGEYERDSGTSGFCAMFALALYRATLAYSPTLVLVGARKNDEVVHCDDGGIWWCHAAVKVSGTYYDIEGKQQPEWMIDNYAWFIGSTGKETKACLIELSPEDFISEIRSTKNARDWRFYTKCKTRFEKAKANQPS